MVVTTSNCNIVQIQVSRSAVQCTASSGKITSTKWKKLNQSASRQKNWDTIQTSKPKRGQLSSQIKAGNRAMNVLWLMLSFIRWKWNWDGPMLQLSTKWRVAVVGRVKNITSHHTSPWVGLLWSCWTQPSHHCWSVSGTHRHSDTRLHTHS